MTIVHSVANWISQGAFQALASLGLWATIVLSLAWLISCGLRQSSAAVRYCLWQFALLGILVLPLLYALVPGIPLGLWIMPGEGSAGEAEPGAAAGWTTDSTASVKQPRSARAAQDEIPREDAVEMEGESASADALHGGRLAAGVSTAAPTRGDASWPQVVAVVWALGVLMSVAFLAWSAVQARKLVRGAVPLRETRFEELFNELASRFSIKEAVLLLKSPRIRVPIALGVLRSRILLPADCVNWSMAQIRIVLSHELAHIERRDIFWQLVARTAAALYWFHPLVWLAVRQMRTERERACDDQVLLDGVKSADYAAGLVELAAALGGRRVSLLDGIAMGEWRALETRLRSILDDSLRRGRASQRVWRRVLLGTTCLVLTLPLLRPFTPIGAADRTGDVPEAALAQRESADDSGQAATTPANAPAARREGAGEPRRPGTAEGEVAKPPAQLGKNAAALVEAPGTKDYTFPISLSGRATDADGKPISGAAIYIASQRVQWKRLAEAKTDDLGRYAFSKVPLPIQRADTIHGRDHGIFIVFGQAAGYGFSWRPQKWYYPRPNPDTFVEDPTDDKPTRYQADDRIELDLRFPKATAIRGSVLDDKGHPLADTELAIWNCELIPVDGYGPRTAGSSRRPFRVVDNNGFELLNADVPPEMRLRRSDAEGRFVLTGIPIGCRLRIRVRPAGFPDSFPARMVWVATRGGLAQEYDGTPLYRASEEIKLVFASPRDVPVQVVYGDTGKPAPQVWVAAADSKGSSYKTTDSQGRVSLRIPPGQYRLNVLPGYKTAYLETETDLTIDATSQAPEIVTKLRPAAEVEIQVVDQQTGKGIGNVDLWRETDSGARELHYTTSWEAATRIVHRDRHRTDADGIIRALFEPGKHRIGVAWRSHPEGYRPVERDGLEIDCKPGKQPRLIFHLRRASGE